MRQGSTYPADRRGGAAAHIAAATIIVSVACVPALAAQWSEIARDGIHDPENPACRVLQEPYEALHNLPRNPLGNKVNWVEALEQNVIHPREGLAKDVRMPVLDIDILMRNTATMPHVRFSHRVHTQWLDCRNCHGAVLQATRAGKPMTMVEMLRGELCGLCHGTVAFPLSDCTRCHSAPFAGTAPPD